MKATLSPSAEDRRRQRALCAVPFLRYGAVALPTLSLWLLALGSPLPASVIAAESNPCAQSVPGSGGDSYWDNRPGSPGMSDAVGPTVQSILVMGKDVYAAGHFDRAGDEAVRNVARWDGTAWHDLAGGLTGSSYPGVSELAAVGGRVFAGGVFTSAGGVPASNIAQWDGTKWGPVGEGLNNGVRALVVSGGDLFAGGAFTAAGALECLKVARWDGTNWSALGAGITGPIMSVYALAASGGIVYAGGSFTHAGGLAVNNVARWDGSRWSALGEGLVGTVYTLLAVGDMLYAGGVIMPPGAEYSSWLARWDGTKWSFLARVSYGVGVGGISAMAYSGGVLFVGGGFTFIDTCPARNLAAWADGDRGRLGSGVWGRVNAVAALAVDGTRLWVGGLFTEAGGLPASNIAVWHIPQVLEIERKDPGVVLSWPAAAADYVLQSKTSLREGEWSAVPQTPVTVGDRLVMTNDTSTPTRFYRLRRE